MSNQGGYYKEQGRPSLNRTNNDDTLVFEEDEETRKNGGKKSLNETEIWGNIITQSTEKSYNKRDYSNPRGSSVGNNYMYHLSTGNSGSKDHHYVTPILTGAMTPSSNVSHYDIEVINNMVNFEEII
jgi:hypothetical protein